MELGLQMFGCTEEYRQNPDGFLKLVREMGYRFVEPCIWFGEGEPRPYTWDAKEIGSHMDRLAANGMRAQSCHVFGKDFRNAIPQIRELMKTSGIRVFVTGYRGPFDQGALDAFAGACAETAEALAEDGAEFWYHNGWREFTEHVNGMTAYEYILSTAGGRMAAELDTGWAAYGGADVPELLERNARHIRAIHYKDFEAAVEDPSKLINAAIGSGIYDSSYAFAFARRNHLVQIVDLDNSSGEFTGALRKSADYLAGLERAEG